MLYSGYVIILKIYGPTKKISPYKQSIVKVQWEIDNILKIDFTIEFKKDQVHKNY